jgi:hypothetical protein
MIYLAKTNSKCPHFMKNDMTGLVSTAWKLIKKEVK